MSLATPPGNGSIVRPTGKRMRKACLCVREKESSVAVQHAEVAGLIPTWTAHAYIHGLVIIIKYNSCLPSICISFYRFISLIRSQFFPFLGLFNLTLISFCLCGCLRLHAVNLRVNARVNAYLLRMRICLYECAFVFFPRQSFCRRRRAF